MQAPGGPRTKLIHKWLKVESGRIRQQTNGQDSLDEHVMDDRFCLGVGERELFERGYFARQVPEVLTKAQYGGREFASQLKSGRMFPVQRDQISPEHQVVTDKDREPGADLDRHGLVVGGPEAESSHAIRRILIRKLQNTEQGRAIAPQCIL